VTRLIQAANEIKTNKNNQMKIRQQLEIINALKIELDTVRDENQRLKERYSEALVSLTRASLQIQQLNEELDNCRFQSAQAERKAISIICQCHGTASVVQK
jgi:predicted  nucleic acid-binding Zn-ribbon protein